VRRRFSFCSAIALIASTVVVGTAGPALAASTTYSGRGIAFSGTIAGTSVGLFADTLALPSTGGHQAAAVMTGAVPNLLAGDTLHASAFGQNDRTRTEAAASGITITSGTTTVTADFAMTRAMAVSSHGAPVLSGTNTISNLVVNGTPVSVTGAVGQVVTLPTGTLTINERTTSISGATGSITVNALHLDLSNGTDFIVASSSAGLTADSSNCSPNRQPTTGGGWITGASLGKGTFGVSARPTVSGAVQGHVVYKDHGTGTRITGPVTAYLDLGTTAFLTGPATQDGQPAGQFTVEVQDNGEPGTTDNFSITTESVPPHAAGGTLQGGNIQIHRPCK
jgi:hypothetical protein